METMLCARMIMNCITIVKQMPLSMDLDSWRRISGSKRDLSRRRSQLATED